MIANCREPTFSVVALWSFQTIFISHFSKNSNSPHLCYFHKETGSAHLQNSAQLQFHLPFSNFCTESRCETALLRKLYTLPMSNNVLMLMLTVHASLSHHMLGFNCILGFSFLIFPADGSLTVRHSERAGAPAVSPIYKKTTVREKH